MKAVSVFNNKGGVGKTTLLFHLAHALSEIGKKVLMIDLDPQCNLSMHALTEEQLHGCWQVEDPFIDDFAFARSQATEEQLSQICRDFRTAHFMLKPAEDGVDDLANFGVPVELTKNLHLVPGRLTLHMFEEKLSVRWSEIYRGDPLAIRTVTKIREIADLLTRDFGYDYVLFDTSPSLGALNKVIISTSDGILVPCAPDMFSLYGLQNIGRSLASWKQEFDTVFRLISKEKRSRFPEHFVQLLGYTIVNAKRFTGGGNPMNLAKAHYHYAQQIPTVIEKHIATENRKLLTGDALSGPLGGLSIMHSYNTFPSMAQKYRAPMWRVPDQDLDTEDRGTILANRAKYEETGNSYREFARYFVSRIEGLPV